MANVRLRVVLCAALSCGSLLPQLTAAQAGAPPSQLSLRQRACPDAPYDAKALSQLLQVELRSLGVTTLRDEPPESEVSAAELAVVQLGCGSAPATLSVELADLVGGNRVVRELVVTDVEPAARARMLSIAISSLLESSWTLLAARPPENAPGLPPSVRLALLRRLDESWRSPPRAAATAEPIELQPNAASEPPESLLFSIMLSGRSFPTRATGLIGLDLALFSNIQPGIRFGVDLSLAYGRQQLLDVNGPVADVGALWVGAGLGLYFASESQPELSIGPLLRLAYVRSLTALESDAFTSQEHDGLAFELGVAAWLRVELGSGWDAYVGGELGYLPAGVVFAGGETRAISVEDVLMALRIGVGRRFW
ncbi:MAG TPA: autotransporter outer membrane beta-barrel domain-containing protein [Polyangiales bacterium]|nr:autotransporter outer membrane beta-barrel domain-containing protein [Polyangiales bacterium]